MAGRFRGSRPAHNDQRGDLSASRGELDWWRSRSGGTISRDDLFIGRDPFALAETEQPSDERADHIAQQVVATTLGSEPSIRRSEGVVSGDTGGPMSELKRYDEELGDDWRDSYLAERTRYRLTAREGIIAASSNQGPSTTLR